LKAKSIGSVVEAPELKSKVVATDALPKVNVSALVPPVPIFIVSAAVPVPIFIVLATLLVKRLPVVEVEPATGRSRVRDVVVSVVEMFK
jgi:hypothetical protein